MRRPTKLHRWAGAGLGLGVLAGLLLQAPARWLALACESATRGQVHLLNPAGSIWNGSAQLVLGDASGGPAGQLPKDAAALPGQVRWRLRPVWLGLELGIATDCCNPADSPQALGLRTDWTSAGMRWTLTSAGSRWPAAMLSGLGAPWNTIEPAGELVLNAHFSGTRVEGRPATDGRAQVSWLHAQSALSTIRPLGSYQLDIDGGASTQVRLSTQQGPLQLEGSGQWVGDKLRFSGTAQASPEEQTALGSLLNLIGQRKGAVSRISIG